MTRPSLLVVTFAMWTIACLSIGAVSVRHAAVVGAALFAAIVGAVTGFLLGVADGPAEAPAYTAVGASLGLAAGGVGGQLVTRPRASSRSLRRAARVVLLVTPVGTGALTALLRFACPLYVSGERAGVCDFEDQDLLGGWISGIVVAFVFDALFVAFLLIDAASRARSEESRIAPEG